MSNYETIIKSFQAEIDNSKTVGELYEVKVKYLGKKGLVSDLNRTLATIPAEDRPAAGVEIQKVRLTFDELYNTKEQLLKKSELDAQLMKERLDITMPAYPHERGSLHPVNKIYDEIVEIFLAMGYEVATGPEAEDDFHNFEALNIPESHPARDMQDTFYLANNLVMRTHTSPVQARTMLSQKPPIKIIAPGKVYRSDSDITHTPMFHQVEGLLVDKDISMANLKGTLGEFVKRMFGENIPVRFRSSFFPFTEPSAEVDMGCVICKGSGCKVCKGTGWIEIGGCGIVAPEVFKVCNIDTEIYSGFAFGMGIERIAMLKYGIDDIRLYFENSLKFIKQF